MTILSSATIPLIADQLNLHGEVRLAAATAHEVLYRAANSYQMELVLAQIATGNGREAAWAKRTLADLERTKPNLKFPSRLVTIGVA